MKKELLFYVILAMGASMFLNSQNSTRANDQVAVTKHRIENASQAYAKTQQIKTVATSTEIIKPSES